MWRMSWLSHQCEQTFLNCNRGMLRKWHHSPGNIWQMSEKRCNMHTGAIHLTELILSDCWAHRKLQRFCYQSVLSNFYKFLEVFTSSWIALHTFWTHPLSTQVFFSSDILHSCNKKTQFFKSDTRQGPKHVPPLHYSTTYRTDTNYQTSTTISLFPFFIIVSSI